MESQPRIGLIAPARHQRNLLFVNPTSKSSIRSLLPAKPHRRHPVDGNYTSGDEEEGCPGEGGAVELLSSENPYVMLIKVYGPTGDLAGNQTAKMVSPSQGILCTYKMTMDDVAPWPAEYQILLGEHRKHCMTALNYQDGPDQFVRYTGKMVTSFYPSPDDASAPGCYHPRKPLHSRLTLITYLLKQTVDASRTSYVEGISQVCVRACVRASERASVCVCDIPYVEDISQDLKTGSGEVGQGSIRVLGGDRQGDDFYAEVVFPDNQLPDGTIVGEIREVKWTMRRLSVRDGSVLESWDLYAGGRLLRQGLVLTASDDGLLLAGKMFLMKAGFPRQTLEMTGAPFNARAHTHTHTLQQCRCSYDAQASTRTCVCVTRRAPS